MPNFHVNFRRTGATSTQSVNDPLYDQQYHLNNTSSNLGTADVDIDAPEAWELETGSSSVTVAVIDDGVEGHEDFYSGQLVNGYTAVGSGNGVPGFGDKHGQSVAGIVAANHNGTGVRGVTSNVQIMPVKIFNPDASADEIEDAIDHAWQNGADVLNNSWGARTEGVYDDGIASAISRAQSNGRDGQGSVVVVSAGNTANAENGVDGFVSFPATVDGVLAVGAVDRNGNPSNYTPRNDPEIDLVAPSSRYVRDQYVSGEAGDVTTMDRMGSSGYESGNYNPKFGGTSAAAPQVAGTAALMLSVNTGLSESAIRAKIEVTADDYGSTNWDGEGRLNARQSMEEAYPPPNAQISSGPIKVTEDETNTWEASAYGGTGSYSVNWDKKRHSDDSWLGTCGPGFSCTMAFGDDNNQSTDNGGIRVTVIDEVTGESDTGERSVSIHEDGDEDGGGGGGGGGGGCNAVAPNRICLSTQKKTSAHGAVPDTLRIGTVAPNPVRSHARLSVALPEKEEIEITLYNTVGQVAGRTATSRSAGRHTVSVNVAGLSSGMYFARVTIGAVTETRRIVVVR